MYGQRLCGHVSLISHPYGDSSAPPYLGTAILTILCFRQTEEQELVTLLQLQYPPGDTDNYKTKIILRILQLLLILYSNMVKEY